MRSTTFPAATVNAGKVHLGLVGGSEPTPAGRGVVRALGLWSGTHSSRSEACTTQFFSTITSTRPDCASMMFPAWIAYLI